MSNRKPVLPPNKVEELIDLVRENPGIYNQALKQHKAIYLPHAVISLTAHMEKKFPRGISARHLPHGIYRIHGKPALLSHKFPDCFPAAAR